MSNEKYEGSDLYRKMQNKQNNDIIQNELGPRNDDKNVSSNFIVHKNSFREIQDDNMNDNLDDSIEINNRIEADNIEDDITDLELDQPNNSKKFVKKYYFINT